MKEYIKFTDGHIEHIRECKTNANAVVVRTDSGWYRRLNGEFGTIFYEVLDFDQRLVPHWHGANNKIESMRLSCDLRPYPFHIELGNLKMTGTIHMKSGPTIPAFLHALYNRMTGDFDIPCEFEIGCEDGE